MIIISLIFFGDKYKIYYLFELGVKDKRKEEDVVISYPSAEKEVSHSWKHFKYLQYYINILLFDIMNIINYIYYNFIYGILYYFVILALIIVSHINIYLKCEKI